MSFARLGRMLRDIPVARRTAKKIRRDDILKQTMNNLVAEVAHAIKDAQPLPKVYASVVDIQEGDKDYFSGILTDNHLATLFEIDLTRYHVRSTVYNQVSCGEPRYAFQVAILKRQ